MTWQSIVQHFQHFDDHLTESVYQHGCRLTGDPADTECRQAGQREPMVKHTHTDGFALIISYTAARKPFSRTAFH